MKLLEKCCSPCFKNPNKISCHLFCIICQQVYQQPCRIFCGHTFCYTCIENWATISKKCPICKEDMNKRELEKDLITNLLIKDLIVQCKQCQWQGTYTMIKKHSCLASSKKIQTIKNITSQNTIIIDSDSSDNNVLQQDSSFMIINSQAIAANTKKWFTLQTLLHSRI